MVVMSYQSTTVQTLHLLALIFSFINSLFILSNCRVTRYHVPFTYCEFWTHVAVLVFLYLTPTVHSPNFSIPYYVNFVVKHPDVILTWSFLMVMMTIISLIPRQNIYVSVQRKSFHFVAGVIFTVGIKTDVLVLQQLCSFFLIGFLIVDFARAKFFPRSALSTLFEKFGDSHQDPKLSAGFPAFLLLYVNTIPLFFYHTRFHQIIAASIITVDVGDAFAAIFGSYFGRKFPIKRCGNKTLIGTVAFVFTAFCCAKFTNWYLRLLVPQWRLFLFSAASGLMELTCENDNLILPFFGLLFV
ncbi:hypothetical protein EIN_410930 [Entamoeba invadens IP1]|uniref:dolichol kinase n=1 Tax=Entamoeba invadens IP1 TaxID=370355 RepID=A0A0A1U154_ENTIV|nr:hypothetical protein EIN_410930 [Entamoeba invadens IP1]ELP87740.1 hypothetical protein EIN_410930 [Entamoeba invadens IP1]|eukprot:XP_004254511.1 hypothetical protein EIN_410930 [Entamoeba invadens IP1]